MQNRNPALLAAPSRVANGGPPASIAPNHDNHGGSAWSLPSRERVERQPQDGSLTNPARIAEMPSRNNGAKLECESDDSSITGGTRSLTRRVLGLNVTAVRRKTSASSKQAPLPAQVA
jgi:hypothetical protein